MCGVRIPLARWISTYLSYLVHGVFDEVDQDEPKFCFITHTAEPIQAFIAHDPDAALKWICQHVSKDRLLRLVNDIYEEAVSVVPDSFDENAAKRTRTRKEPTTRQVNKRLKEKFDIAMLEAVANTQDFVEAKQEHIAYNSTEQRYRAFAKSLRGIGVKEVAEMIHRASTVATVDCLQDWRVVLDTWRELHREGKRLFANIGVQVPGLIDASMTECATGNESMPATQLTQTRSAGQGTSLALTGIEVASFRQLLATVKQSETADILGDIRHRWVMAALYKEYERLEGLLRQRVKLTGQRGRGLATVAREQLFSEVHRDENGNTISVQDNPTSYRSWSRYLEYGKRWKMLKDRFGVGIFALLPRGGVPNSFVERRPLRVLQEWIEMIARCNERVKDMAEAIEPLLLSCLREEQPPGELLLETVDSGELGEYDLLDLLLPAADTQRNFEVVSDNIDVPDSQLVASQLSI